jgi:hypothetical protein
MISEGTAKNKILCSDKRLQSISLLDFESLCLCNSSIISLRILTSVVANKQNQKNTYTETSSSGSLESKLSKTLEGWWFTQDVCDGATEHFCVSGRKPMFFDSQPIRFLKIYLSVKVPGSRAPTIFGSQLLLPFNGMLCQYRPVTVVESWPSIRVIQVFNAMTLFPIDLLLL